MFRSSVSQNWLNYFSHLPTISTRRLILRPASMRDAEDLYECCRDADVARYVLWEPHSSVWTTRNYLRYMIRQYRQGAPSTFVIEHRESKRAIGTIGYMWMNEQDLSCEVGYSLGKNWWNQGYATEALKALLEFSFLKLRLNRVEAQHDTENPASGHVMRKSGMLYEGTLRQRVFNKGKFVDVALYAILRSDYEKENLS